MLEGGDMRAERVTNGSPPAPLLVLLGNCCRPCAPVRGRTLDTPCRPFEPTTLLACRDTPLRRISEDSEGGLPGRPGSGGAGGGGAGGGTAQRRSLRRRRQGGPGPPQGHGPGGSDSDEDGGDGGGAAASGLGSAGRGRRPPGCSGSGLSGPGGGPGGRRDSLTGVLAQLYPSSENLLTVTKSGFKPMKPFYRCAGGRRRGLVCR